MQIKKHTIASKTYFYDKKSNLMAILVRDKPYKEGVEFFTPEGLVVQGGLNDRPKGTVIEPHAHYPIQRLENINFAEVFILKKGRVKASLYDTTKNKTDDFELESGDLLYLLCGHGFEFLEDSQLYEVKQGPYRNKEQDKYDIK